MELTWLMESKLIVALVTFYDVLITALFITAIVFAYVASYGGLGVMFLYLLSGYS